MQTNVKQSHHKGRYVVKVYMMPKHFLHKIHKPTLQTIYYAQCHIKCIQIINSIKY